MDEFLKELAALLEKHDVTIHAHWCNDRTAEIEICVGLNEELVFDYSWIDECIIRKKLNHPQ